MRLQRRTEPRPWFASPSGSRYHSSSYCNGLNAADLTGTVKQLSTRQVRARNLTPCAVCQPSSVTALRIVPDPPPAASTNGVPSPP